MKKIGGGPQHIEFLRRFYGPHRTGRYQVSEHSFVERCVYCGATMNFSSTPCKVSEDRELP